MTGLYNRRRFSVEWVDGRSFGCTASIGTTSLAAHNERFELLIERAYRAMYRAKRDGKNRVVRAVECMDSLPAKAIDAAFEA